MSGLTLHLLGQLRVIGPDGADLAPRSRKTRALLGILALTPGATASRGTIAGLLWSDRAEEQARASLRQAIAELRETAPAIASHLQADRMSVGLDATACRTDVALLADAIAKGDLAVLSAMLPTLALPLMADMDGLSPDLDDWLRIERARFESSLLAGALGALSSVAASREQARTVATHLQRLFEGNEEAARLGMELDHAAGDLASLHRRYRLLEEQMKREFDGHPSAETRTLFARLTAFAPVRDAPAPEGSSGGEPPVILLTAFAILDPQGRIGPLGEVLQHDLVASLSRLPDLRVLMPSGPVPDRPDGPINGSIAGYRLGGSIRPTAHGLQLAFTLTRMADGSLVWSHRTEADEAELGSALDDAVERVAGAMLPTVERDLVLSHRLDSAAPEAYALYLRGRTLMLAAESYSTARKAADLLEKALEIDSGMISARLHLVGCYNGDFMQMIAGHDATDLRARALKLAQEAVSLEPRNPNALARLGWTKLRAYSADDAEALIRSALELGPHHADNVEQCGAALALLGHATEGAALIQHALALNPFPRSDYFADFAITEMLQGRFSEAASQFAAAADPSILYLALEAACLGHLKIDRGLHALRQRLAAIWAGAAPCADDDIVPWVWSVLPLVRPEHRAMVEEGLRQAGLAADPAAHPSNTR